MAYIGVEPSTATSVPNIAIPQDIFTGTGSQTNFTLTRNVVLGSATNILVLVDNVVQQPVSSYTISGSTFNTLVFSEAPENGSVITVLYLINIS